MKQLLQFRFLAALLLMLPAGVALGQTANFTATPLSGCSPKQIQFTSTSTGTISTYSWNFGNGATSAFQNPSTTYTSPGTYTVSLTVSGGGNSNTKTITNMITIHPAPSGSFSATNTTGCLPLVVPFTSSISGNVAGAVSYTWNFGDGSTDTGANPTHTYNIAGTFNVTVTATNSQGCTSVISQPAMVTVYGPPPIAFSSPATTYCFPPVSVPFLSTGTSGATVTWNFGDGTTGSGTSPTHVYTSASNYTVTAIATNAQGCTDSVVKPAYIHVQAHVASINAVTGTCIGQAAAFTNSTPVANGIAAWDFGDGGVGYGALVTHNYANPGTYVVRMVTLVGGCSDTVYATYVVYPNPTAVIVQNPAIPCPAPVTVGFSGSSSIGASTYQWSWGSGGTASGASVTHAYNFGPRRDSVKLVVTSQHGCKDSTVLNPILIRDMYIDKNAIAPVTGCAPLRVHFEAIVKSRFPATGIYPSPVVAWNWNFGDGSSSTLDTVGHVYTTAGTYTATITLTTANGCTVVDTVQIKVGSKIKPSFTVSQISICGGSVITATNTTVSTLPVTYSYTWDTATFLAPNVNTIISSVPGVHVLTLHSLYNGCEDTTSLVDSISILPSKAIFVPIASCPPNARTASFLNGSIGATSWLWRFGDGDTSTVFSPTHTYAALGTYTVTLITYNSVTGCADSIQHPVLLLQPTRSFTADDTTLCLGDTLRLHASYSGFGAVFGWAIDNIRLNVPDTMLHPWAVLGPGYHTVTFYDTSRGVCRDSLRKQAYVFVSKPTAAFTGAPLIGCAPLTVTFTDNSVFTPGAPSGSKRWNFGNGNVVTNNNPTVTQTYYTASSFSVQLLVKDIYGCADSTTYAGYVQPRKVMAGFGVNRTTGCIGEQLTFTNSSSGAPNLSYKWTFGDGSTSTAATPSHAYAATGSYTVTLIAADTVNGCTDTLRAPAYITITKPTASFTLSDTFSICTPLVDSFHSTSINAATLAWTFGDGNSSGLVHPVNTYVTPGVFSVRLIAIDAAGCRDTAPRRIVRVLGYAGALTYSPVSGCVPLTVHYRALITNAPSLIWDFSDGATAIATGDTISHTYLTPGAYVPKLIFSNNAGCVSSSIGVDTIKVDVIKAGFITGPVCERTPVRFTDTSRGLFSAASNHEWRFDNGKVLNGSPVSITYPAPGTHTVTLVVTSTRGCRDSITLPFTLRPLPIVRAPADTAVCPPDAVSITANGATSYIWSPATGLSCTACAVTNAGPLVPTTYIVTGTDTAGCFASDTIRIGIQAKTTFITAPGGEVCLGKTFPLSASGATLYSWLPDQELTDGTSATPIAKPTVSTTYIVTAREGSCAADTHAVRVIVRPLPTVDAGTDERVVAGKSVLLQASGSGISKIAWADDSTLSCLDCYAPEARPKRTTVYYVTATNIYNCTATDSVTVRLLCDGSQLFIPNTFTPNGDGLNDYFFPRGEGLRLISTFRIFSRWGELLYERKAMAVNDELAGWDGSYKSRKLDPDVYVYWIEAQCDNGEPLQWKGDVTLMR